MAKYSIVVPFHNEEENVTILYARLKQVMEQVDDSFELIFVDDGSNDRTYKLLEEVAAVDSRVLVVKLRRNFGQTSALAAGFDHASGDFVLAMDGDLQHDPNDIPAFLEKLDEGYDVVSGWRKVRIDNFIFRRVPSACANWIMARLSGVPIHDFGTTFKAYRREVIQNIPLYGEMHRFIPALASLHGASIFFDLMTIRFLLKHMSRPLHFFGGGGILAILAGGVTAAFLLALKLINPHTNLMELHGPMFVIASVLIVSGVQLLALGLLGELQVRHYYSNQRSTSYTVDRLVRLESSDERTLLSESKDDTF